MAGIPWGTIDTSICTINSRPDSGYTLLLLDYHYHCTSTITMVLKEGKNEARPPLSNTKAQVSTSNVPNQRWCENENAMKIMSWHLLQIDPNKVPESRKRPMTKFPKMATSFCRRL